MLNTQSWTTSPSPEEQKAVQILHNDPQMRAAFISNISFTAGHNQTVK